MQMSTTLLRRTNWYVITGGPCSGKSSTVSDLRDKGYKTTLENARLYLDMQKQSGRDPKELERHHLEFQIKVLQLQIEQESALNPSDLVFLDRAIPDARAYYRFLHLPEPALLRTVLETVSYRKIFILEPLPLVHDYARHENRAAQREIHDLITWAYESLPFPIVHVPAMTRELRMSFILSNL